MLRAPSPAQRFAPSRRAAWPGRVMPAKPQLSRRACQAPGQPISFLMEQALAHPHLISLAAGFVDQESLPVESTRQAFEALWSDPRKARRALQYGTTPGDPALRERLLAD